VEFTGIYVSGSAHLGQLVVRCLHKKQQTLYFTNIMSIAQYKLKLERAEDIIAYHPKKPEEYYLWEALQVAGSGQNRINGRSAYDGNKRLAIVGDAAMALALTRPWYEKNDTLGSSMKILWTEYS
jgi:hypothetical protein